MLDDLQIYAQKDPSNALGVAALEWQQAEFDAHVLHPAHDGRAITKVVIAGMGGSALAALLAKSWLESEVSIQIEVVRSYTLPRYVGADTLVVCSSYSGNTEETLEALHVAQKRGAQIAILTSGGALLEQAKKYDIAAVQLPSGRQPRMATIDGLRGLIKLLEHFAIIRAGYYDKISRYSGWLKKQTAHWLPEVTTDRNIAKQLALFTIGKTPVFYAGHLMAPVAYKWKISWNENAKNVAFWNEYPEFNHNEFMGWTSHPIEKPFAIVDLVSDFEHRRIQKRFALSDKLLSGKRPKAHVVRLQGDTVLAQMLWGCVLADFVSIYVAIVNGVDPTPVKLIEKFKQEMK